MKALDEVLPPTPWVRRGAKGEVRIYRYAGERTTRIKDADGKMICEILSKGTQIVLPPSIHPDTGREYVANADLWEVFGKAVALPMRPDLEIKTALKQHGVDAMVGMRNGATKTVGFVPSGARDNQMVYMAGLLARTIVRGERTMVEALGEITAWVTNFTERVAGDDVSVEKARMKLVEFLLRDVKGEQQKQLPPGWDADLGDEDRVQLGLDFTADNEVWPAERILEYLGEQFERYPDPHSSGYVNAVQVALDKIARCGDVLRHLDEHRLIRYIVHQSQGTLNQVAISRQLREMRAGDLVGEDHTELAHAVLKHVQPFGDLRFEGGDFWQWRGACWERLEARTSAG